MWFLVDKEGKIPTSQFTIFRRDFINDEIKELNNISNQNPDNNAIQFAVQVLLENYRSASAYLDDMKEESRESIISMPIYNLLIDKLDIA